MSDTCGAETATGEPCTHPPTEADDRCWIHTDDDPKPGGRPSLLSEYEEDILTGARQGMTLKGCARLAGVAEKTLHDWINKYDDFRKSLKRARAHGELQHLQNVDERGSQFILERSFGYVKTENLRVDSDTDLSEAVVDFENTDT
jgi:hypothetical protein